MFGFSLAELILVFLVALIFIKPQDLPEIAYFIGRLIYRGKKFLADVKKSFKETEKELGLEDLKHELNRGMAAEKIKLDDDATVIVDIYGNEHRVSGVKEEMKDEVKKLNEENLKSLKQ